MRKERIQTRSKLYPRKESPFQALDKINYNFCKLACHGEYNVNVTFNISNFSLFDVGIID